jgi:hypothetical protein
MNQLIAHMATLWWPNIGDLLALLANGWRWRYNSGLTLAQHISTNCNYDTVGPALVQYNSTNGYSITIGPLLAHRNSSNSYV